jgi:hypothetical protein
MPRKTKAVVQPASDEELRWNVTVIDKARIGVTGHIVETQIGITETARRKLLRKYYDQLHSKHYLMEFELVKKDVR